MIIQQLPSPNFDARPEGTVIDTLVLHYTGMRSAEEALTRLCLPEAKVSAHYIIDEEGAVYQLVEDKYRAWHAGVSSWRGREGLNANSIGIELVNPGHEHGYRPFPAAQMQSVLALCARLCAYHPIEARNIIAHSDIAPARKEDPGELFDWSLLAAHNIGLWHGIIIPKILPEQTLKIGDSGEQVVQMQSQLARYGYDTPQHGIFDRETAFVVIAFKRHFYPRNLEASWDELAERIIISLLSQSN
jgi:N-acetylmuramoyl-L-alanine amidase